MKRSRRIARAGALLMGTVTLASLAGCSQINQHIGDAWRVTYEVRVDQTAPSPLTHVSIDGAAKRGEAPTTHVLKTKSTAPQSSDTGASTWTKDFIVLATDRAKVSATPVSGATATCRIVIEKKVIALETADPGQPVTCSVKTPTFGK